MILCEKTDEEIIAQLIQVKGIGRWTAEMFLIFCLGRLDVLPVTDLGIRKAMQKIYALPELPKPSKMLAISQPWRPIEVLRHGICGNQFQSSILSDSISDCHDLTFSHCHD